MTENKLDLAIQGRGFFRIEQADGEDSFTRAGSFQLSPEGEIVTPNGLKVAPGISIPEDAIDITVNENGEVAVKLDNQVNPQIVGQLELVIFFNEAGLKAIGDNLFLETPASGQATVSTPGSEGVGTILQGFLETSNVDPVSEITALITAQRAYEMNSKVITTSDEMLRTTANLR